MQSVEIDSVCSSMIKINIKRKKNITRTYKENVVQMTFYLCISESHVGSSSICPLALRLRLQDLMGGRRNTIALIHCFGTVPESNDNGKICTTVYVTQQQQQQQQRPFNGL